MSLTKKQKLIVTACCRGCGRPLSLDQGVVAASTYGPCCSAARLATATRVLKLKPITAADFDGLYLTRRGR